MLKSSPSLRKSCQHSVIGVRVGTHIFPQFPFGREGADLFSQFGARVMAISSIVFVGIAPHPPVMIPEVGAEMAAEVSGSIAAMRVLTERIIAGGAQTVIIVSPHAPLQPRAFVGYREPRLRGDFANFRAPQATVDAPFD